MTQVFIAGIGILGPGLKGWVKSAPVLRGQAPYLKETIELDAPAILTGRERRRSNPTVRLALNAAQEAVDQAGIPAEEMAAVFGSSVGSGLEVHQILEALTKPDMPVSPTQFHNSVHNSAVGYWCIATSCHQASTSIAGYDYTFPAALLKAAVQTVTEDRPVLLSVFDCPFPEPLNQKRPIASPFGVALVLIPSAGPAALAKLSVSWRACASTEEVSAPMILELHQLWQGNPAGRAIPLFEALAVGASAVVELRYPDDGLLVLELQQ